MDEAFVYSLLLLKTDRGGFSFGLVYLSLKENSLRQCAVKFPFGSLSLCGLRNVFECSRMVVTRFVLKVSDGRVHFMCVGWKCYVVLDCF